MRAAEFAKLVRESQQAGDGHVACCPAHDDKKRSLAFRDVDGKVLVKCFAGCELDAIMRAVGKTMADLFHDHDQSETDHTDRIERIYDYVDEKEVLLYQVVRAIPKKFWQRRPDGKGGWENNMKGVRRVLYRLPAILASPEAPVIIHEGEKAVEAASRRGR